METVNIKLVLVAGLVAVLCLAACGPSATPDPASDSVSELPIRSTISPPTLPMFTLDDTLTAELAASMSLNLLYPTEVVAVQVGDEVQLTWNGSGSWLDYYEVLRKIGPLPARSANTDWQRLANTHTVVNENEHRWNDRTADPGNSYIYGVRAVNIFSSKTSISESAPILVDPKVFVRGAPPPPTRMTPDQTVLPTQTPDDELTPELAAANSHPDPYEDPTQTPTQTPTTEQAAANSHLGPSEVTATQTDGDVVVRWRSSGPLYRTSEVYRRNSEGDDWQLLASLEPVGDHRGWQEWRDTTGMPGVTYFYGVSIMYTNHESWIYKPAHIFGE